MAEKTARLVRLLHLVSPSLPTGAFAYSQGLEWAVARGWIENASDLKAWLADLITHSLVRVDVPLFIRMMDAIKTGQNQALTRWCDLLLAFRETAELRLEEKNRGRAMAMLLEGLGISMTREEQIIIARSQLAGFALAAVRWQVSPSDAATGYLWSWLENQVLAGIKIIPLGQTEGHRILLEMDSVLMAAVKNGMRLEEDEWGASSASLAISSSQHETQYTRLYRS